MNNEKVVEFDRSHLWHPYTSMIDPLKVYQVRSAEGVRIELESGERLIDGMSSWWCVVHGYNHPLLNSAIEGQLKKMAHVMFGGLTHAPAVELGQRLVGLLPAGLDRIFYCDSGSVAVEVSIKMALQYMQAAGLKDKTRIATIGGGYHGDTWHAMSVCDPVGGMHSLYNGRLPIQFFAPRPSIPFGGEWDDSDFEPMRILLDDNHNSIAAVIVEPVVQGAGGMWFYHPEYLKKLRALCDQYGVLLIADEIATGFMRTGRMFGCDWAGIVPDIMCLGKAITGGYMSFAAVAASGNVADTISGNPPYAFMHGPTFMGNPLACSVACASIDLISDPELPSRIEHISSILNEQLCLASDLPGVKEVRILGSIGVIEMVEPVNMEDFQEKCVALGIWVRPFGRLVYIMPPYIISDKDLVYLCRSLVKIVGGPA